MQKQDVSKFRWNLCIKILKITNSKYLEKIKNLIKNKANLVHIKENNYNFF